MLLVGLSAMGLLLRGMGPRSKREAVVFYTPAAGADFLAITDHYFPLTEVEWADMLRSADEHTEDGAFVAMAAYEFYLPGINEFNIYGTETLAPHSGLTPNALLAKAR